jgi:tetratricopeptide (TPR) repeat protein
MDFKQAVQSIKQHVVQGNLDQALQELLVVCDADDRCGDLGHTVRLTQAEYNQLKGEILRGTISNEDARLATNRINTRVLELARRLQLGEFELEDNWEEAAQRSRRRRVPAWQYYVAGGLVALGLAFVGWRFLGGRAGSDDTGKSCPTFKEQYTTRVMVLPFRRSNTDETPEFDISDGLNSLFNRTPAMQKNALSDVLEGYPIETDYPNPAEAEEKASQCGVQMIVWGRVSGQTAEDFKINVFYRLLNAKQLLTSGDTTISRLVTVTDQGNFTRDGDAIDAITNLLYLALANQLQVSIPGDVLAKLNPVRTAMTKSAADSIPVDTLSTMVLAEHYIKAGQSDQAIELLDTLLVQYPEHSRARQTRAALLWQQGKPEQAAHDLEIVASKTENTEPEVQKALVDTYIASRRVEDAEKVLKEIEKKSSGDKWTRTRRDNLQQAKQQNQQDMQQIRKTPPKTAEGMRDAAVLNRKAGNEEVAVSYAARAVQLEPDNVKTRNELIRSLLASRQRAKARLEYDKAKKEGIPIDRDIEEELTVPVISKLKRLGGQ